LTTNFSESAQKPKKKKATAPDRTCPGEKYPKMASSTPVRPSKLKKKKKR